MELIKNTQNPLVSIIVITYNSAKYVYHTLESIRLQSYQHIELIISDDCSNDNTLEICEQWLEMNPERFFATKIIKSPINTGIAPNCNRGLKIAKGDWVKFIAGDDMLLSSFIECAIIECNKNPSIEILFSKMLINGNEFFSKDQCIFFTSEQKLQYKQLLKGNILQAPASFIKITTAKKINGFDEDFPLFEDFPFFLKASKSGIRFHLIDESLVFYRIHETNVSRQTSVNFKYLKDVKRFFRTFYLNELLKNGLYLHYCHYMLEYILINLQIKKIITNIKVSKFILKWGSFLFWKMRIKRLMING